MRLKCATGCFLEESSCFVGAPYLRPRGIIIIFQQKNNSKLNNQTISYKYSNYINYAKRPSHRNIYLSIFPKPKRIWLHCRGSAADGGVSTSKHAFIMRLSGRAMCFTK